MMSINTSKLNETEIICPSDISYDENCLYNDSLEKSIKENRHSSTNKSNILLNALKDFSVRYDLDDRKIMKSKKFLLSFEDLISLVKFTLEFQIKINNSLNLKDYLNEISQDFINNLSYYVFSYEKIDTNKNNNVNINYNTYNNNLNNKRNEKQINIIQTPINYQSEILKKKKSEEDFSFLNNKSNYLQNIKSYYTTQKKVARNNNGKTKEKKMEEISNKKRVNKSVEKRRNVYMSEFDNKDNNEENKKNGKANKSTEKRRNNNNNKADKSNLNNLSIFTACENLKYTKSRRFSCIEQKRNKNNLNYYTINNNRKDDNNKGVKKQIISNNVIRPSNMANKLLLKGIKYITDFRDLKEEESKKKKY